MNELECITKLRRWIDLLNNRDESLNENKSMMELLEDASELERLKNE